MAVGSFEWHVGAGLVWDRGWHTGTLVLGVLAAADLWN